MAGGLTGASSRAGLTDVEAPPRTDQDGPTLIAQCRSDRAGDLVEHDVG
jgi:hypothetical protein